MMRENKTKNQETKIEMYKKDVKGKKNHKDELK